MKARVHTESHIQRVFHVASTSKPCRDDQTRNDHRVPPPGAGQCWGGLISSIYLARDAFSGVTQRVSEMCGGTLLSTHSQELILSSFLKGARENNGLDCNLKIERIGMLQAKCEYKHANLPPLCTQTTKHDAKGSFSNPTFRILLKCVSEIRELNCFNR